MVKRTPRDLALEILSYRLVESASGLFLTLFNLFSYLLQDRGDLAVTP